MTPPPALLLAAGLAAPAASWFLAQQASGGLTYFACAAAGPPLGLLPGLLGLAACVAAGGVSLRGAAERSDFAAAVGLGLAGIFGLANLFTLAAIWLIPPCAR